MAAFLITERDFRYLLRTALILVPLALLLLAPQLILTGRDSGPLRWEVLFSGNYAGRFSVLTDLLRGRLDPLRRHLPAALRYLRLACVGSGFLALGWFLPKKREMKYFVRLSILIGGLVALSAPSVVGPGYSGYRLHYLAPLIFFIPLPTVAALLTYSGRHAKRWFLFLGILLLLAATRIKPALDSYREAMAHPYLEVSHRVCLLDFLARRFSRGGSAYDRSSISLLLSGFPDPGPAGGRTYAVIAGMLENAGLDKEAESWRRSHPRRESNPQQ
jgi:hypothetical protein